MKYKIKYILTLRDKTYDYILNKYNHMFIMNKLLNEHNYSYGSYLRTLSDLCIDIKYIKLNNVKIYFEKTNKSYTTNFDYIRIDIFDTNDNLRNYITNNKLLNLINIYNSSITVIFYYKKQDIKKLISLLDEVKYE